MNFTRAIAATAVLALAGLACGDSAPADRESTVLQSRDGRTVKWGVRWTKQPRALKIGVRIGYCVGEPKPIADPEIKYRGDDVFIRMKIKMPREGQLKKGELCEGVELFVGRAITLRRDLSDVRIYDGGVEPPELRWP